MESVSLEQIIRQYVQLPLYASSKGWYPVLHTACDKGHKGPRAAFKFDGDTTAFHCFNCPDAAVYNPHEHSGMSKTMTKVLHDFGVPDDEIQRVVFSAMQMRATDPNVAAKANKIKNIEPDAIDLPSSFYPLKDADSSDKWAEIARYYLQEERGIDPDTYPFYLSERTNDPTLKKWYGRVIIPIYKDNKLVFYQGRDLTNKAKKKYESPGVTRECVLYGYDKLFKDRDLPLYIVEGWFDAFVIDGVAILGNELSQSQIEWINRSYRKKVYIPDRRGDGKRGAETALRNGWSVSIPDTRSCKDINEAVLKYGKLFVMKSLIDNTFDGFEAQINMGVLLE